MLSGLHLASNWEWSLAAAQKLVFPRIDESAGKMPPLPGRSAVKLGRSIITRCASLAGCRRISRIDANLCRFSSAPRAGSEFPDRATASSFRAATQQVSGIRCCRHGIGALRIGGTHYISTAAFRYVAPRHTANLVELAARTLAEGTAATLSLK